MITQIGIVAGEIWRHLDEKDESTLLEIYSTLDYPNDIILMSLGWLAREGHVILEKENDDFKIYLRARKESSV